MTGANKGGSVSAAELLLTRAEAKLDTVGERLEAAEQALQTGRTVAIFLGVLATLGGLYLTYLGVLTSAQGRRSSTFARRSPPFRR